MLFYVFLLILGTTLVAPTPTLPPNTPITQTFKPDDDVYGFRDYLIHSLAAYSLFITASAVVFIFLLTQGEFCQHIDSTDGEFEIYLGSGEHKIWLMNSVWVPIFLVLSLLDPFSLILFNGQLRLDFGLQLYLLGHIILTQLLVFLLLVTLYASSSRVRRKYNPSYLRNPT